LALSQVEHAPLGGAELFAGAISMAAADFGFEGSISLSDCFTLSPGKNRSLKALFAARDKELTEETERRPFDFEIRFLEDHEPKRRINTLLKL
jgi:hypothetical protein